MSINNNKVNFINYIVLTSISFLFFACTTSSKKTAIKDAPFIPNEANIVIKCNDFKKLQSHLNNNNLSQNNSKHILTDYFKNISALSILTPKNQDFYLCYSPLGKSDLGTTLITPLNNILLNAETIEQNTTGDFSYNNQKYSEVTWNEKTFFTTKLDSNWVATDNKLLIENSIRQYQNKTSTNANLVKSLEVLDNDKSFSVLLNNDAITNLTNRFFPNLKNSNKKNWSGWTAGDYTVNTNAIIFDGVYKPQDSIYDYTAIFSKTNAQKNKIAQITPTKAKSFTSFTFDDYDQLSRNLTLYNSKKLNFKTTIVDDFIAECNEFGYIELANYSLNVFSLLNDELDISSYITTDNANQNYRDITIYKTTTPIDFSNQLKPLITASNNNYYVVINGFVVFSETINGLKELISAIKNEDTLTKNKWYKKFSKQVANESNLLHIANTSSLIADIAKYVSEDFSDNWKKTNTKDHEVVALQLTADTNFSHIHQVICKNETAKAENKVSQIASVFLENNLLSSPQLVKNYVTKGMDALVQDKSNILYLLSSTGNVLWKKQLNAPILGKVQQMDIYRNGRLQLVFTTSNALHVLDRKGNNVKPFPIQFEKPITQPVALFDYDNNRKYRIGITQGSNLRLFSNYGKEVKGFKFKNKKNGTITHTPKHVRIGTKDYILVNENNQGLHILNRTGKERIKIKNNTAETSNEWYWYKNAFTTITNDNLITQVNTKGAINNIKPIKDDGNIRIDATSKTMATITENTLTIKNKKVNLDYGVYTAPKIFYINNKVFIAITDTQSSKVYLYDSNAKLISGFPVYGNSIPDIENIDKDKSLEMIVKGDNNNVLFYEFR